MGKDFAGEIEVSRHQLDEKEIITIEIPDGRQLKVQLSPPLEGGCLRFQGLINRGRRDLYLNVKIQNP